MGELYGGTESKVFNVTFQLLMLPGYLGITPLRISGTVLKIKKENMVSIQNQPKYPLDGVYRIGLYINSSGLNSVSSVRISIGRTNY